ncbi:glycosyltransferase [Podospora aff. communis PSN243]|uniref:Glycosyltransferase n=1 Tax=Podospora aff. communis PSN243 TaxID=3040156 RepID=A0AAV9GFA5_9PEZI|nr:glycosyltransferase [Podospora aff. communis PSN243]
MGVAMSGSRRCLNMRNPFGKALILAIGLFVVCTMVTRSDRLDVRTTIVRAGTLAKEPTSSQQSLSQYDAWQEKVGVIPEQNGSKGTGDIGSPGHAFPNTSHPMTCDYNMGHLRKWQKKYGLEGTFEYSKRYVRVSRQDIPRRSMTKLQQSFLPEKLRTVNVSRTYKSEPCPEPLIVPVSKSPFPSTANLSEFMFGISTIYNRFNDPNTSPVSDWTYWLTNGKGDSNGGKLLLMLADASVEELGDAADQLAEAGIDADVYRSDGRLPMAVRYLALVPTMYKHRERRRKKWLVTADDDTFFLSPHRLGQTMRQYDAQQPMYIGTFSEDVNNIDRHGPQAFGGAGVFLSVPTAQQITEDFDLCKSDQKVREANSGWGAQGDILLRRCITDNSETQLTLLNDLWQLDMYGDPSGFYESGRIALSLHHYRGGGWHIAHPRHYTKVARICGEDCTLQRFQTADDFILSNGFSVAYYPEGIDFDTNQVERTFSPAPEDKGWNFDFTFGPQRPSLHKTGRKISWDLQEAIVERDGSISQIYVRKHDDWRWKYPDGSPMSNTDGIIEVVWLRA